LTDNWTIVDRLHLINVPTLLINGRYEQADDAAMGPYFANIPKVKWVTLEQSSHMPFYEEKERYMKLVEGFLAL
jgi:pimeloyl-ACP methyl ester carboxylesterase